MENGKDLKNVSHQRQVATVDVLAAKVYETCGCTTPHADISELGMPADFYSEAVLYGVIKEWEWQKQMPDLSKQMIDSLEQANKHLKLDLEKRRIENEMLKERILELEEELISVSEPRDYLSEEDEY